MELLRPRGPLPPRRGGAARGRSGRFRPLVSTGLLVVVTLLTVGTLLTLKHIGERAVAGERDLTGVQAALNEHDATEWRALSGRYQLPAIEGRLLRVRGRTALLLGALGTEGMPAREVSRLTAAISAYERASDHSLELLSAGRLRAAQQYDDRTVDPAFQIAARDIDDGIAHFATRGQRARRFSDAGLVVIVLVAVGAVLLVERRRRRLDDRRRAEAAHQARHDALTGLPNRIFFFERLRDAIARAEWSQQEVTLLYVDVDDFKGVNDAHGHRIGDEVLQVVAERMRNTLRGEHVVARLGGDEFVVLLERVWREEAARVAERLVRALREEMGVDGVRVQVSATIGVAALSDVDAGSGRELALLGVADLALYSARADGSGPVVRYLPEMSERAGRRREVEAALRSALAGGGLDALRVVYQPVVRAADGTITGVEALARLDTAALGLISPVEFVPLAEETGLVVPMGRQVLREACRTVVDWNTRLACDAPLSVSVNVSVRQLRDADLVADVRAVLDETGLPPDLLTLEITETQAVSAQSLPMLLALKSLGLRLAVDDFGTGYASLQQLELLPLDTIKIDRSFVEALEEHGARAHIVTGVLRLARDLGLDTIAEGVETVGQRQQLVELGCPLAQGFLFSRPLPADGVADLLAPRGTSAQLQPAG